MAQTLKFGNGTWATKKGSILAHNDEDGNYKPLPFTYTGAGKGTRVNKEGLIEVVENDRPRIDYTDSEDGVFLLENASTNLITYSEDFSNSYWTKDGTTIIANSTTSPDGTFNADNLVESSANSQHYLQRNFSSTNGLSYTYKIYVKMNGRRNIALRENGSTGYYVSFDLLNGIILEQSNATGTIKKLKDGWFEITHTSVAGNSFNVAYYLLSDNYTSGNPQTSPYQGDGTSGVYIFGAMLEQSSQSSSYIPTQGTIQTRVQETASGSGNSEVFSDSQGVLYLESSALADDGVDKRIAISDGTMNNYVSIGYSRFTGNIVAEMFSGGVLQTINWGATGVTQTNSNKFSLSWGSGTMKFYVNGFQTNTEAVASPIGINVLDFADANGTLPMYSKTKELAYYDEILTDLELETLTSYRTWEEMVKELNLNIIHNE